MPCIRGVEVSIVRGRDLGDPKNVTGSDARFVALPEFPHSDSSSINLAHHPQPGGHSPRERHEQSPYQKTQARVSVHIPSEQGLRFAFEWSIKRPKEHPNFVYFVVLFNGRRIVSWGTDPKESSTGLTEYALYEPSNQWEFSERGVMVKRVGMEKRYFYFNSAPDNRAASHGGHIEIQVFRAKGRKLHDTAPPDYRIQENWGIICPSGGLAENPHNLKYYDWHLLDHVKNPYITFRFHYRSWESLRDLSIIPPNYPTIAQVNLASLQLKLESNSTEWSPEVTARPSNVEWPMDAVFRSTEKETKGRRERSKSPSYSLRSPLELLPTQLSEPQQLPQPFKRDRDNQAGPYPERPLPVLPHSLSCSSSTESPTSPSSRSRSSSRTPSIAASLLSYIDDLGNGFEDCQIITAASTSVDRVRGAKVININNSSKSNYGAGGDQIGSSLDRPLPEPPRSSSPSDYGTSPPASECSQIPLHQREEYLPTTGSALDRHLADLSPKSKSRDRAISDTTIDIIHVTIPEAHWMRPAQRTPSPLRRRQTQTGLNLLAASHADGLKAKST